MDKLAVDKLGQVDLTNYPVAKELQTFVKVENYDAFSFKSCGGSCGDSNCS